MCVCDCRNFITLHFPLLIVCFQVFHFVSCVCVCVCVTLSSQCLHDCFSFLSCWRVWLCHVKGRQDFITTFRTPTQANSPARPETGRWQATERTNLHPLMWVCSSSQSEAGEFTTPSRTPPESIRPAYFPAVFVIEMTLLGALPTPPPSPTAWVQPLYSVVGIASPSWGKRFFASIHNRPFFPEQSNIENESKNNNRFSFLN